MSLSSHAHSSALRGRCQARQALCGAPQRDATRRNATTGVPAELVSSVSHGLKTRYVWGHTVLVLTGKAQLRGASSGSRGALTLCLPGAIAMCYTAHGEPRRAPVPELADVAQLAEQWFCKPQVRGSSPLVGSESCFLHVR